MDQTLISKKDARIFAHLVQHRRATRHFRPDPVPDDVVETALGIAAQAPSGYNFQPWRFLILTDPGRRAALRSAAFNQEKITEAPIVVVAYGQREGWKEKATDVLRSSAENRGQPTADVEKTKNAAMAFVERLGTDKWLNRHVMIAFTTLMYAFESLGWDTAPMEGFDGEAVKKNLQLPPDAEVVALLAVGRGESPDSAHPGRLDIEQIAFRDRVGEPWPATAIAK